MRLSGQFNALSFDGDVAPGPYPPQGFVSIAEGALGNGDCFGLYWPLGREGDAPFVCEMFHDEWRMELRHSSVQVFSRWLELNEGEYGEHEVEDPGSPSERLEQARARTSPGSARLCSTTTAGVSARTEGHRATKKRAPFGARFISTQRDRHADQ